MQNIIDFDIGKSSFFLDPAPFRVQNILNLTPVRAQNTLEPKEVLGT